MKFTISWLKEHLETTATLDEIVEAMTMAGLEVESVENPAQKLAAFTVGKVLSAEKHPDADRLKVCQVQTLDGEKQIVCGAPNARAGIWIAFAPVGAYVPGIDVTLKAAKIRGVESFGMMCSAKELEMGEDHDGILELSGDNLAVGQPVAEAFDLNDPVIDFEVTPNRPDWLGVASIARDLAAAGLGSFIEQDIAKIPGAFACPQAIRIDDANACPAFAGRVVRGVKNRPSPDWVQNRLRAIGLRPISALVDMTNLMSYDRARPLHVYDLAKVQGTIVARLGKSGETLAALDDKTYDIGGQMCVIADDTGAIGLGGVMGGTSTGVDETTRDVFIECALFDPARTMQTGRDTGITSDARYRFERGVDSGFVLDGMQMATQLVLDWCGGEASEICLAGEIPPPPPPVDFEVKQLKRLTGLALDDEQIKAILQPLGFTCGPLKAGRMQVDVPTWRRDVKEAPDLVEELARIYGYDKLPMMSLVRSPGELPPKPPVDQTLANALRYALAGAGYHECITWSFVQRAHAVAFGGGADALVLANPISSELDCMRPSALIHLLLAAQRNTDRGQNQLRFFEVGPVFDGDSPKAQRLCAAGIINSTTIRHWQGDKTPDIFTAKAAALQALSAIGAPVDALQTATNTNKYWHPGRSGALRLGPKNTLAEFGELHPQVLQTLGVDGPIYGFEIWPQANPAKRQNKTTKPALQTHDLMAVSRDFAFIITDETAADTVVRAARGADKKLITQVSVFDLYAGQGIEPGHKSLGIEVTLQPTDHTLSEAEIEAVCQKIIAKVQGATGGTLRG
ncbi:Phenylalanyl-tRNA synthetase beta chain [hydrothermal vent metagenome]|uniref:Phenylalanine--tRNA ligase beta subunit n=1 Tax=hydrothermal vent metagenome TaxID=652676 RepID=A0A3B0RWM3_9ZZZZ